jgi:hypothetical protein
MPLGSLDGANEPFSFGAIGNPGAGFELETGVAALVHHVLQAVVVDSL